MDNDSSNQLRSQLKCMSRPVIGEDSDWVDEFRSSDPGKPSVKIKSLHIHHTSHPFDPTKDYVGLIVYLCNNKSDFYFKNQHSQTGDIYIKQSNWIIENIRERPKHGKYVHGRLFYSIFGCWKRKKHNFVGAGFSYTKGEWKINARTLNTMNRNNNDDTYHNTDNKLSHYEEKIIKTMWSRYYVNHCWLRMEPEERVPFKTLKQKDSETELPIDVKKHDISQVHPDRRLRGKVIQFNYQKGYGFIDTPGFPNDIFVHRTAIDNAPSGGTSLQGDDSVEFRVVNTNKGWQARKLTKVEH
ncbi:unnamed protein product [Rotaria socialis]|uniref:CSD domain-containing protein n=2 Tax=Rotaria socialis TaxID=392032 RepID=A0A820I1M4_9BILA|nr:unnamed protein product [Rotaria socialis]CAF3525310.1 unnamed protein product [Rotaria socialis]CAF3775774.1 unnamed protein product [Rotaria socialis]CAF4111997.1 unnamed protein product [Rotaria socialis]CAF4305094.1 unnamed protein product [Rotaria socialis]